jgi:hypothetical protein
MQAICSSETSLLLTKTTRYHPRRQHSSLLPPWNMPRRQRSSILHNKMVNCIPIRNRNNATGVPWCLLSVWRSFISGTGPRWLSGIAAFSINHSNIIIQSSLMYWYRCWLVFGGGRFDYRPEKQLSSLRYSLLYSVQLRNFIGLHQLPSAPFSIHHSSVVLCNLPTIREVSEATRYFISEEPDDINAEPNDTDISIRAFQFGKCAAIQRVAQIWNCRCFNCSESNEASRDQVAAVVWELRIYQHQIKTRFHRQVIRPQGRLLFAPGLCPLYQTKCIYIHISY